MSNSLRNRASENLEGSGVCGRFSTAGEASHSSRPNSPSLFLTPESANALEELTYGIQARTGLILLTGVAGTGKTTLIRCLLEGLHERAVPVASTCSSDLEGRNLYELILREFRVTFVSPLRNGPLILRAWLSERSSAGQTAALIVDDAENLPFEVLEEIRMLLNLETPCEKMLQIVLVGRPKLDAMLERPELYRLKQRITVRCKTVAFDLDETHQYVGKRFCTVASRAEPAIFPFEAREAVYSYSRGIPRLINLLCAHVLIKAYAEQVRPVTARLVAETAHELGFEQVEAACLPLGSTALEREETSAAQAVRPSAALETAKALTASKSVDADPEEQPYAAPLAQSLPPLQAKPDSIGPENGPWSTALASQADTDLPVELTSEATPHPALRCEVGSTVSNEDENPSPARSRRPQDAGQGPRSGLGYEAFHRLLSWVNRSRAESSNRRLFAASLRWLREPANPIGVLLQWLSACQKRCLSVYRSTNWTRIAASLSRWLREPFDPFRWLEEHSVPLPRLRTPHLFDALRPLIHKKP